MAASGRRLTTGMGGKDLMYCASLSAPAAVGARWEFVVSVTSSGVVMVNGRRGDPDIDDRSDEMEDWKE